MVIAQKLKHKEKYRPKKKKSLIIYPQNWALVTNVTISARCFLCAERHTHTLYGMVLWLQKQLLVNASGPEFKIWHTLLSNSQGNSVRHCDTQFIRSVVSDSLRPHGLQQARPPCLSPTPRVYSNSCPLSRWSHLTISSPSSPSPPNFNLAQHPMSQFFASGGQSMGVSASASVLPMNIQDWSPLGWTGWISSHSKELSRVFSYTTVQKHRFFSSQLSL